MAVPFRRLHRSHGGRPHSSTPLSNPDSLLGAQTEVVWKNEPIAVGDRAYRRAEAKRARRAARRLAEQGRAV